MWTFFLRREVYLLELCFGMKLLRTSLILLDIAFMIYQAGPEQCRIWADSFPLLRHFLSTLPKDP